MIAHKSAITDRNLEDISELEIEDFSKDVLIRLAMRNNLPTKSKGERRLRSDIKAHREYRLKLLSEQAVQTPAGDPSTTVNPDDLPLPTGGTNEEDSSTPQESVEPLKAGGESTSAPHDGDVSDFAENPTGKSLSNAKSPAISPDPSATAPSLESRGFPFGGPSAADAAVASQTATARDTSHTSASPLSLFHGFNASEIAQKDVEGFHLSQFDQSPLHPGFPAALQENLDRRDATLRSEVTAMIHNEMKEVKSHMAESQSVLNDVKALLLQRDDASVSSRRSSRSRSSKSNASASTQAARNSSTPDSHQATTQFAAGVP